MKKIFKELFELFVKTNKREPNAIETLQLKFKASQQVGKGEVIEFPRERITDWTKARPQPPEIEIIDGVQTTRGLGDLFERQMKNIGKKDSLPPGGTRESVRKEAIEKYGIQPERVDEIMNTKFDEKLGDDLLKDLDPDDVPFAEGGSTSTGLNYLLGEDDTNSRVPYATGGRRGFLKILAGLGAAGAAFKTGLIGLGKGAAKPAVKVAAEAATSTAPPHFLKLVAKIKALGDDAPRLAVKDREVVTTYSSGKPGYSKDYTLTEDVVTGEQTIQRSQMDDALKYDASEYYGRPLQEEVYMSYKPGKGQIDETTKGKTPPDEYTEDTSLIRNDKPARGEISEEISGVPDDIFEEVGEAVPEAIRKGKADGGRMGYAGGKKVVEGLISLLNKKAGKDVLTTADKIAIPKKTLDRDMFKKFNDKNPDPKKEMTEDEYQDFADEIGENIEAYDFDGTVGDANRIRKDIKDYEAEMYQQYKMGKLDPEAGDKSPARKRFLEKKFEEMEDSGDPQLMTRDEIEELTFFDLGTEMDDFVLSSAEKKGKKLADSMSDAEIDLRDEFPGIEDRLIKQILTDNNPQRVAEVKQTMREALEMQNKGISVDEIIQTFKGTTRTKQASGGRIGLLAGGGVLKKLIMNLAKEKGMSGSEVLKVMNYKSLPSKIKNLMTKEEFTSMKDQRLEGVEIWRDLMASQQEMTKNIDAGKNTPAAELFEMLEKTSPGYKTVPRNISDADMLQMEQMIKNMKTKDNRQLNAKGGLANLLGE